MKTVSSSIAVAALFAVATIATAAPFEREPARQSGASTAASGTQPRWQAPGVPGARAAAAKGPTALRLYVQRTRMIYGLRYEDYLQP